MLLACSVSWRIGFIIEVQWIDIQSDEAAEPRRVELPEGLIRCDLSTIIILSHITERQAFRLLYSF